MEGLMAFRNDVSESQLHLDLEMDLEKEVLLPEEEEFLSLLDQVLTEIFVITPDEESFEYLEGRAIYDLSSDKEIADRLKYEAESLNEGSPDIENLVELEAVSRSYFENPKVYPLDDDDFKPNHVTGFIQIYSGEKFDSHGRMSGVWKSFNKKVILRVSDLMDPSNVIAAIELHGIKWSSIFRVIFYGSPLVEILGSGFYSEKEARELLPLNVSHPNILLALPDYEETEAYTESIYDWLDKEFQDGILCGSYPEVNRVTSGHYEMTTIRLQEVFEEELEEKTLNGIIKRETLSVARKNQFIETYQEARSFIKGANEGEDIDKLYTLKPKVLEDILFLCNRGFERLNDPIVYAQVKSLATKLKVGSLRTTNSKALMIIQKINGGEPIETHLLSLADLESIFEILWSNIGIKIENKEVYYDLKEKLRVARFAKSRNTKGKGR
jgi:hypothetical protein